MYGNHYQILWEAYSREFHLHSVMCSFLLCILHLVNLKKEREKAAPGTLEQEDVNNYAKLISAKPRSYFSFSSSFLRQRRQQQQLVTENGRRSSRELRLRLRTRNDTIGKYNSDHINSFKLRHSTVSKNKSPFQKIRQFFNIETQSQYSVWLCNFDPGLFLTFISKTQMGFYFLRL